MTTFFFAFERLALGAFVVFFVALTFFLEGLRVFFVTFISSISPLRERAFSPESELAMIGVDLVAVVLM